MVIGEDVVDRSGDRSSTSKTKNEKPRNGNRCESDILPVDFGHVRFERLMCPLFRDKRTETGLFQGENQSNLVSPDKVQDDWQLRDRVRLPRQAIRN